MTDIDSMAPHSGRILTEDGRTINIADIIGGTPTGEHEDIEKYSPHSGRFIKEDGSVVNIAENIGGGGSTAKPLTLSIGGTDYVYDGTEAVNITLDPAEGVTF